MDCIKKGKWNSLNLGLAMHIAGSQIFFVLREVNLTGFWRKHTEFELFNCVLPEKLCSQHQCKLCSACDPAGHPQPQRFSCPVTPLFPRYKFHHLESDTTLKAVEQKEQAQLPAFPRRNRNRLMPSRLLHNDPLDSSQAVHGAKSQAALHYSLCTLFSIGNRKTLSHIILFLFHQL